MKGGGRRGGCGRSRCRAAVRPIAQPTEAQRLVGRKRLFLSVKPLFATLSMATERQVVRLLWYGVCPPSPPRANTFQMLQSRALSAHFPFR